MKAIGSILTTASIIGLAAALMLAAPADVQAEHQWMNASGSVGYHLKRVDVDSLVLKVQDNHDNYVSNDGTWKVYWPAIFQDVIDYWSQSIDDPSTTNIYDVTNSQYGGDHLDLSVVNKGKTHIKSYNGYYGNTGWLGIAFISIGDFEGHIRSGEAYQPVDEVGIV